MSEIDWRNISAGCCGGCPARDGISDEATMAQNYGCLPSLGEIVVQYEVFGISWACHSKPTKVCNGLLNHLRKQGKPLPEVPTCGEVFGIWHNLEYPEKPVPISKPFEEYALGTKALAHSGGHWIKTYRGWKWHTGSTFPTPGGDAFAMLEPKVTTTNVTEVCANMKIAER